ncbi:MAG: hypothetical protein ACE5FA_07645, partial [Dehalococcoidia bacterium]
MLTPDDIRQVVELIRDNTPVYLRPEHFSDLPPTDNQVPQWSGTSARYEHVTLTGVSGTISVEEDNVSVHTAADVLDFQSGFDLVATGSEIDISLDLSEVSAGGELGGTMDAPTVNATHSGSAHHTKYTDAEAVAAVEAENPLDLAGVVKMADGSAAAP